MAHNFANILIVGKSRLSNAICHAICHANEPRSHNHRHSNSTSDISVIHNDGDSPSTIPFNLTLLTRINQVPTNSHGITHIATAFDLPSLTTAFKHQNIIISTINYDDVPFQKLLIDATVAAGVRRFIPYEFSYNTRNARVCERFPPCQARAEVLQYLIEKSIKHQMFSWTGLATGCIVEEGLKGGLLGFDLLWSSATVYESGEERFACSTLRGVAKAVIEILAMGEEGKDQYFYAAGFMTCQNDILKALTTSSRKDWSIGSAEVQEALREGEIRMEKGFFDGAMLLLERSMLFGETDDLESWQGRRVGCTDRESLEMVIGQVLTALERDGEMDCGCG